MKFLIIGFCIILSILAFAGDINTKKSFIKWHATKVGGEHWGHIKFKDGNIQTNDKGEPIKASFTVDMSTIDVRDLEGEWKEKLQNHLRTGDFFEISKYPTATMETSNIKKIGDNKYRVKGNFKIKNKIQPITFDMTYNGKLASGSFSFDRTKFGIMYRSTLLGTLGDKVIHDKVDLEFKVQ
ncbi:YceI family protein [Halobacteriovorax sp. DPLXC-1]|uniref:YceI family protein n=1 Tax=unclassified Halobacteriovorax TaxID=2639665 RepID=UPI002FF0599B